MRKNVLELSTLINDVFEEFENELLVNFGDLNIGEEETYISIMLSNLKDAEIVLKKISEIANTNEINVIKSVILNLRSDLNRFNNNDADIDFNILENKLAILKESFNLNCDKLLKSNLNIEGNYIFDLKLNMVLLRKQTNKMKNVSFVMIRSNKGDILQKRFQKSLKKFHNTEKRMMGSSCVKGKKENVQDANFDDFLEVVILKADDIEFSDDFFIGKNVSLNKRVIKNSMRLTKKGEIYSTKDINEYSIYGEEVFESYDDIYVDIDSLAFSDKEIYENLKDYLIKLSNLAKNEHIKSNKSK